MTPAVSLTGVGKVYGHPTRGFRALDDINLTIEQGDFYGLLGPNGAGKTTLIQIMAGLTRTTTGRVSVMGYDVARDPSAVRRRLGVVPQELVFDPFFTVRETLRIQSGLFGLPKNDDWIDELLHALGLSDKAQTNLRSLSGGMKRRVLVAQALVHRPAVIVLDEPTAGVDIQLRESLWQFIRGLNDQGHTILLTTHYLEEAEKLCRRLAFLRRGSLACEGLTTEFLATTTGPARLEQVFRKIFQEAAVE